MSGAFWYAVASVLVWSLALLCWLVERVRARWARMLDFRRR